MTFNTIQHNLYYIVNLSFDIIKVLFSIEFY